MPMISYTELRNAVAGEGVALRAVTEMQPAGGPGDRVFPPTYADGGRTRYAVEDPDPERDGHYTRVLLDSVASQANRLELALEESWERGELQLPVPYVDFRGHDKVRDLDRITVLQAPHRIADALFRDSLLDGTLFRLSDIGQAITEARPDNATAMFQYAPTSLLFGVWDSTGPKGGLGAKFQRAIVSEIVGHDVQLGVKVSSRIDPAGIEVGAGPVYAAADGDQEWTLNPEEAKQGKGKPVLFDRRGQAGEQGRPSQINHGNITPSIDRHAGGVYIHHATQTLVLSLAALRKLRFATDATGEQVSGEGRREIELTARTAVAAIGVAAAALQIKSDHDLRSRCLLVPQREPTLELLGRDGSTTAAYALVPSSAGALVAEAAEAAARAGIGWHADEIRLEPAPKLVQLIERSREIAAVVEVS